MITKIGLKNVASYKESTELVTNKKVNLIYGLNGTGKSTLSNYLYYIEDEKYNECHIDGIDSETEILVYNQKFIHDNFYEPDSLKGIFTLSKTNKEAEQKIKESTETIKKLAEENIIIESKLTTLGKEKKDVENKIRDDIWPIKTQYTGGDDTWKSLLSGPQRRDALFDYLSSIDKPPKQPTKDVDIIKKEYESISGGSAQKYALLPYINREVSSYENNSLLSKVIVGNENSSVANLIDNLKNSDWVEKGLSYINTDSFDDQICPFCQQKTISSDLINSIKEFFDEAYKNDKTEIIILRERYLDCINKLPDIEGYSSCLLAEKYIDKLQLKLDISIKIIRENLKKLDQKVESPSLNVKLTNTSKVFDDFNDIVRIINEEVELNNNRINEKDSFIKGLKQAFWELMRWEYDSSFILYNSELNKINKKVNELNQKYKENQNSIENEKKIIQIEQKKTVNIDEAISNIKSGLLDLGIDSFFLEKTEGNFYRISRDTYNDKTFITLSEGEKMIISFLYFIELCKGKTSSSDISTKKIIVIDDPISSLSHIYIFNIGQLIKKFYTDPKSSAFEQVFILTHSLYFFYELTLVKDDLRHNYQKLFRIIKNENGSKIETMSYQAIQNDYQAYWYVIKDKNQSPALIANCMRNIIEYFFNFVEKYELHCVFQKPKLQDNKFQAFYRYINRESHSVGQNIFDIKEFDYDIFKEGFELVFNENGYENHFKRMMK